MRAVFFSIVCYALVLSGCSLTFQNNWQLNSAFHAVFIETDAPYDAFIPIFKTELMRRGSSIVNASELASLIVDVRHFSFSIKDISIGNTTETRQYEFTYAFSVTLKTHTHRPLIGPFSLTIHRTYFSPATQVLETIEEKYVLLQEMRQQAILTLMNRLRSQEIQRAIATS